MSTKIGVHWQRTHEDKEEWLFAWNPSYIKIVFDSDTEIPGLDMALKVIRLSGKIILRQYQLSENFGKRGWNTVEEARIDGIKAGRKVEQLWGLAQQYNVRVDQLLWEGLNEPNIWGQEESPEKTSAYYVSFLHHLQNLGLRSLVLNLGVGWPGNDGTLDNPPNWTPFESVKQAMVDGDVLGLHEYWDKDGPQKNWKWWAGRYTQCPWQVPIIISECGVDSGVSTPGEHWGYQAMDGNPYLTYLEQLKWYDNQIHKDPRILAALPFTYDFAHPWGTFDIRRQTFMESFIPYVQSCPEHDHTTINVLFWGHKNLTPWRDLSIKYAKLSNIDPRVIGTIIMLESSGNPKVVSNGGAVGLMQVMPRESGFPDRPTRLALLDPETNISWGTGILKDNLDKYKDLARALACYYGGDSCAKDLNKPASILYITVFIKWWNSLWKTEPPVRIGEPEDKATKALKQLTVSLFQLEQLKQSLFAVKDILS